MVNKVINKTQATKWGQSVVSFTYTEFPSVKRWQFWKPCSMAIHETRDIVGYTFLYRFFKFHFQTSAIVYLVKRED